MTTAQRIIAAGQRIQDNLPLTSETALELEARFDAITGRRHSLGLQDSGIPAGGRELNADVGATIIRIGRMVEKAEEQGRTNEKSNAAALAMAEVAESI